jgi:hypothetical protein
MRLGARRETARERAPAQPPIRPCSVTPKPVASSSSSSSLLGRDPLRPTRCRPTLRASSWSAGCAPLRPCPSARRTRSRWARCCWRGGSRAASTTRCEAAASEGSVLVVPPAAHGLSLCRCIRRAAALLTIHQAPAPAVSNPPSHLSNAAPHSCAAPLCGSTPPPRPCCSTSSRRRQADLHCLYGSRIPTAGPPTLQPPFPGLPAPSTLRSRSCLAAPRQCRARHEPPPRGPRPATPITSPGRRSARPPPC